MGELRKSAGIAIIGIGESEIGALSYSSHGLLAQAANRAITDAGIKKSDIDGLITGDSYAEPRTRHGINFAQYLGLHTDSIKYIITDPHGSTGGSGGHLTEAMMLIHSGMCKTVLVVAGDNNLAKASKVITRIALTRDQEFEAPYGTFIPGVFGMVANRYMHDYGATEEDFADVTVAQREWCNLTPNGFMRDEKITKEDVLRSPMVASPHRRLSCPRVVDGACAYIVTSAERARDWGDKAVTVLASEHLFGHPGKMVTDDIGTVETLYNLRDAARVPINRAYEKSGLTPETVDLFFSYDPFPFIVMLFFEALGLCGDGEGHEFVRNGRVAPGGELWWNTHGGLCAYGQAGVGGGTTHLLEACRQLRHEADKRQKPNAQTAIYAGEGANWGTFPVTVLLRGQP